MPTIRLYNKNKLNSFQDIEYDFGDEALDSLIKKFDKIAVPANYHVFIGDHLFKEWTVSLDACLMYGESITVFCHKMRLNFVYQGKKKEIHLKVNETIAVLRKLIEKKLDAQLQDVKLRVGNKFLDDPDKEIKFYDLDNNSSIEFEGGQFVKRELEECK